MQVAIRETAEFGNTPGYWYALAYFIAAAIFVYYNPKKGKRWFLAILPIWAVLEMFMTLTAGQSGLLFIVVMIIIGSLIYLMMHFAMDANLNKRIYNAIRAFMLGEFAGSLGWQVFYFLFNQKKISHIKLAEVVTMLEAFVVIFVIAFFAEKRHKKGNREIEISNKALLGIAAMALLTYTFSNLSYVVTNTPFTTMYTSELFMIRSSADFMGVALLYAVHEIMQQTAEKIEAQTINNMLQLQYSQYQVSEKNIELVNQKYHDLKHQIRLLQSNLGEAEGHEYLDQMMSEIKQYEAQFKTGNRVLDTILSSESLKCQSKGIEITVVADGHAIDFMNAMDISALFGNALDNAIEGAEKIASPEERLIYLTVDRQKGFLRVHLENRFDGKVQFRHHLPVTTKSDKNIHGYGVKSMKQIAEKYGGSIRAEATDGWFKLYVLIPMP